MGCCSGTDFTPAADAAPDASQRVNYSFGMVLGVDDFRQEHAWLAGRDARALREAIGYGVLAGLDVQPGQGGLELRVEPGLALAPDGRLVAVTAAQCARLDRWLAGAGKQAPVTAGARTLYVLLGFDEQTGTPVPIPGEPCRDESAQQADSRWTDGFALALSWEAPPATEDRALRQYADWLHALPVHDAPPASAVSLAQFVQAIEDLVGPQLGNATLPPPPARTAGGQDLVLPRNGHAAYLAAAFDLWTRRLRLQHLAHHGPVQLADSRGSAETTLLLASVALELDAAGALVNPSAVAVQPAGRPLLHLQLLQQWLLSTPADKAPHDARYVLGSADPRLGRAQNLLADFFPRGLKLAERQALAKAPEAGPMARVDRVLGPGRDELHAELAPAVKYAGQAGADYYGPGMAAPIPVADGGTGQAATPADGQLLVGNGGHFTPASLLAAESDGHPASLSVTHGPTAQPDITLDTVQPLHPEAQPTFAALTLSGPGPLPDPARPVPALHVSGGSQTDTLRITTLAQTLLAADAEHRVAPARRWDGGTLGTEDQPPYFYAPGQEAPVRLQDGGTGLATPPRPMQLLVGRPAARVLPGRPGLPGLPGLPDREAAADSAYVLAELTAGANVSLGLKQDNAGDWRLRIDATGGTSIALPLAPTQGGTGLASAPQDGQLLVGATGGLWQPGRLFPGANASLLVTRSADGLVLDTSQALHAQAAPGFAGLRLSGLPALAGPAVPALQVSGGASLDALALRGSPAALLASDADGRVQPALRWDAGAAAQGPWPTTFYGPGQTQPVRIADGGTGLAGLPALGQLLIGSGNGRYALGSLVAGPAGTLTVTATANGLQLATSQGLGSGDSPSFDRPVFNGLTLNAPLSATPARLLGLQADGQVVASSQLAPGLLPRRLVVVDDQSDIPGRLAKFSEHDWVLVYAGQKSVDGVALPDPLRDGQFLMLKLLPGDKIGSVVLNGQGATGQLDGGGQATLALKPGQGVTLVGCVKALGKPTWLIQSRG